MVAEALNAPDMFLQMGDHAALCNVHKRWKKQSQADVIVDYQPLAAVRTKPGGNKLVGDFNSPTSRAADGVVVKARSGGSAWPTRAIFADL